MIHYNLAEGSLNLALVNSYSSTWVLLNAGSDKKFALVKTTIMRRNIIMAGVSVVPVKGCWENCDCINNICKICDKKV